MKRLDLHDMKRTFPPGPESFELPKMADQPASVIAGGASSNRDSFSVTASIGGRVSPPTEEDRSAALTEALVRAGFVFNKVRAHFLFTRVLESMWSNYGFKFSGNFTEGWGYNLFAMNGRPGLDSSVTYRFVAPGQVVHFEDCDCLVRGGMTCRVMAKSGKLKLSRGCLPAMKQMGLVVSMDGEVLNQGMTHEVKQKLTLSRSSANPEVHFTEELASCPNFARRVQHSLQSLPARLRDESSRLLLLDDDRTVWVTLRPRRFVVVASFAGGPRSSEEEPTADADFSAIERQLFQCLDQDQGHLYMVLKFLLLEELPNLLPGKQRPFNESHCKQLLWRFLACSVGSEESGSQVSLIGRVRQALCLMADLLTEPEVARSPWLAMRSFFDPRLTLDFAEPAEPCVDRALLCRVLRSERLSDRCLDAYAQRLGGRGTLFVFRPLLMTIPGSSRAGAAPPTTGGMRLADYPSVGFRIYRALEVLLDEASPTQEVEAEFNAIAESLLGCATTASACLRSLMLLKLDRGAGQAHEALVDNGPGQISVTDAFDLNDLNTEVISRALLRTDCAWLYRGKLTKHESDPHNLQWHSPRGTAFLGPYPLIRFAFFSAQQKPILHSDRCCFEYRLRINFVALWHSLRNQLGRDWAGCEPPSALGFEEQLEVSDPQELVAQVLVYTKQTSTQQLLETFKSLVPAATPFHRDRSRSEWRWVHLIRLHLMGTWIQELRPESSATGRWTAQQRDSCHRLLAWCGNYDDLFYCTPHGCGVGALLLHAWSGPSVEMQIRSVMQSLLETELERCFPLGPEFGFDHDLLVMQLYAAYTSNKKAQEAFRKRVEILVRH